MATIGDEGAEFRGERGEPEGGGGSWIGGVVLLYLAGEVGAAGEAEGSQDTGQLVCGGGCGRTLGGGKVVCGEGCRGGFKRGKAIFHLRAELEPHPIERACKVGLWGRGHSGSAKVPIFGVVQRFYFQPRTFAICCESVSGSKGLKRMAWTPRSAKRRWSEA